MEEIKKKGGRPIKTDKEKTKQCAVRFDAKDMEIIEELAVLYDLPATSIVKIIVLDKLRKIKEDGNLSLLK